VPATIRTWVYPAMGRGLCEEVCERGRSMTYAPAYGKVLSDRSIRCREGVSGVIYSGSRQVRTTDDADIAPARSALQWVALARSWVR
jgi:hypothetical protein